MLHRRRFIAGCLALAALPAEGARAASQEEAAVDLTATLLHDAHAALQGSDTSGALRAAVRRAFAFDVWEKFLIQSRAELFGEAERQRFREMLPGFLAHLYHNQFDRGLDREPSVGEARKVRRDVLVMSTFQRTSGPDLPVEWRIRDFPDRGPQVIDIMVGGTSFLLLKRDEFTAIIDKGGVQGLFAYLAEHSL